MKYHSKSLHSIDAGQRATQTNALDKWIATDCRPIPVVEDVDPWMSVLRIATNDNTCEPPSRCTVVRRIHK